MDKFSMRVLDTVRRENLIPEGSLVTVGFSGGADSVCLLSVLCGLKALLKCEVAALHVNHMLRGAEADRDEEFCREFCRKRDIPFSSVHVNVREKAEKEGLGTEEAARILRYEALSDTGGLVAVAHHSGDQAETVLFHLIRGSGLKGLAGMDYRRDRIIRPLLDESREEILKYLEAHGLSYVTDSTNAENDCARNRIRNAVLPELEKINPKAGLHLAKAAQKAAEAEEALEEIASRSVTEEVRFEEGKGAAFLPGKKLKHTPPILRRYVIIETVRRLGIPLKDWSEAHFAAIDRTLGGPAGLHLDLPGGVRADNTKEETVIRKGK